MLDAIEEAQTLWYRPDHRHTLQHCQFISQAQMRRAAKLGVCLNMFVNHIYYWGDIHRQSTLGYSRSRRMQPLRSAYELGIPVAMHSDAPVTPLGPLFSMWCALARRTATDQVLGEHEALSMDQALYAVTLGAAYTLHLDDQVGSLEVGKYADMVVLEHDLYATTPDQLRDNWCFVDASLAAQHSVDELVNTVWERQIQSATQLVINRCLPQQPLAAPLADLVEKTRVSVHYEMMPAMESATAIRPAPAIAAASSGWHSLSVESEYEIQERVLVELLQSYADTLYRAKGRVCLDAAASKGYVVQYTRGSVIARRLFRFKKHNWFLLGVR